MQARWATSSTTETSLVCPMPVHTGTSQDATARATSSWSKAARSALAPPPRTTAITSTSAAPSVATAVASCSGTSVPWTALCTWVTTKASPRCLELTQEVVVTLGPLTGHQTDPQWDLGHAQATLPVVQVFIDQGLDQPGTLGGHTTHERLGVELSEDEVDRPTCLVELHLAPGPDDHADLECDAQSVERPLDPAPGARPALGVELGGAGVVRLVRVDQVEEAVAAAEDVHGPDLTGDPHVVGKGRTHRPVHTFVELGDTDGVRCGGAGGGAGGQALCSLVQVHGTRVDGRRDGVADHGGGAGSRCTGESAVPDDLVWDHGGDGEPAGWPRSVSSGIHPGRGRVEEGRDSTGQGAG